MSVHLLGFFLKEGNYAIFPRVGKEVVPGRVQQPINDLRSHWDNFVVHNVNQPESQGFSQFHGHGYWLVREVALTPRRSEDFAHELVYFISVFVQ